MKRVIAALLLCTSVVGAQDGSSQGDAFYAAIRANDLTRLAALLKAGADPNAAEPRGGMTPLMHTAVSGSLDAMRMLLDKGASVNAANGAGLTALMMSVTDTDKVSLLLERGADVNAVTKRGRIGVAPGGDERQLGGHRPPADGKGRGSQGRRRAEGERPERGRQRQ